MKRSLIAMALLLSGVPALAHHSFDAEYDASKITTISGFVTKVDWQNPHAFVYVDVTDPAGSVKSYRVEMGPPYALVRPEFRAHRRVRGPGPHSIRDVLCALGRVC